MNEDLESRIASVRREAEGINVRIREAEARLREFAFISCKSKSLAWDAKAKIIKLGIEPVCSLSYGARTRICTPEALQGLIVAALLAMEKSLGREGE